MGWIDLATLAAMLLVSAGLMSAVFQWLKTRLRVSEQWRAVILYAMCLLVGLAQSWLAGDLLNIINALNQGVASAGQVFALGSTTFALATAAYNVYVRPRALARAAEEAAKV
jgi:hypothetical protein